MPPKPGILLDESRLQAVAAVLSDNPGPDEDFDRIARLAAQALSAPTSLITLISATTQNFRGVCGAPEGMGNERSGPHANSLCKHTVLKGEIVSITNARVDPRFSENPIVNAIGIQAYLGIPLVNVDGHTLGSICVIDFVPRQWSLYEIDLLRDYAAVAVGQMESVSTSARMRVAFDVALHDLKTPLSGIMMASSMVSERLKNVPEDLHPLLKVVETSTEAAVKLVKTLAAENRQATSRSCDDPVGAAEMISARLMGHADSKDINVMITAVESCSLKVPSWVLEQILENLISNAIKFSPVHSTVQVTFLIDDHMGHFLVADEGPGFSDKDRLRIFTRYARLSAMPTGNESSTGIGLSIVKRLADQNGGQVELVSAVGESSVFRVSFPLVR